MRRIIMFLTVALLMAAMMLGTAMPAMAAAAQLLPSDQGTILQATPQTLTHDTITTNLIPTDPYRAVCVPPNPVRDTVNPVCPTIT
jgi:hypothetical protein